MVVVSKSGRIYFVFCQKYWYWLRVIESELSVYLIVYTISLHFQQILLKSTSHLEAGTTLISIMKYPKSGFHYNITLWPYFCEKLKISWFKYSCISDLYCGRGYGFRIAHEISSSRVTSSCIIKQNCQYHIFNRRPYRIEGNFGEVFNLAIWQIR